MFYEPEFWVAVAFVILMGVFAYYGIHRSVLKTLDHRSERIKAELDDARRLKEEAAKLLAEYKARHASAEREAQDIIATARAEAPRRMVAIETNMGILPQFFFPEGAGKNYQPSPYLEILKDHLSEMTVFSGVSHPGVDGGHQAERSFLTAAPHPGTGAFKNSISLDQLEAERIGAATRFPTLVTQVGVESRSLSFTRSGVMIPSECPKCHASMEGAWGNRAISVRDHETGKGVGWRCPDCRHEWMPRTDRVTIRMDLYEEQRAEQAAYRRRVRELDPFRLGHWNGE